MFNVLIISSDDENDTKPDIAKNNVVKIKGTISRKQRHKKSEIKIDTSKDKVSSSKKTGIKRDKMSPIENERWKTSSNNFSPSHKS